LPEGTIGNPSKERSVAADWKRLLAETSATPLAIVTAQTFLKDWTTHHIPLHWPATMEMTMS
jgi:hypothetical protein